MARAIRLAALLVPILAALSALRADDAKDKPKAVPEGTPLELSVRGKQKYALDAGGQAPADYRKKVEEVSKGGNPLPTPAVELTFEVKNTSDKPVEVWASGDPVVLTYTLKGKGALNLDPPLAFTEEFRIPRAVEVPAGKSYSFKVDTLASGFRGRAHYSYWTEPGEYELVATLKTGAKPAPKGAGEGMDGFGLVTLTSAPLTITVEAKK